MKAARIHEYGHSDRIQIDDVLVPAQSSTDVLVRIDAAGVNPVDWKIREGFMAKRGAARAFPFTLGQDFAGQVIAVGEDVTGIEADEEVYGFANGAYAEFAVVSPESIANKPITVDDATAAALPTPGLTALQAVRAIDPQPGQTVLIHGAAGGVGSIATQLCLARGARVLATASSRDADYLRSLGVAEVIDYKTQRFEDFAHDVDAAIDVVGGETQRRTLAILKPTGKLVSTVGLVDQARGIALVMKRNPDDLRELARLVDAGTIKPHGTRVLPLEQASAAQDLNQQGKTSDKLVLGIR
jgi:NADPH:quinone reductase-like Zn-dependent oxidoreductase